MKNNKTTNSVKYMMEQISEPEDLKQSLLAIPKDNAQNRKLKKHEIKVNRNKMFKQVSFAVCFLVVISLIANASVYAMTQSNLVEFFLGGKGQDKVNDISSSDEVQKVTVGDYDIELKEVIYEPDTQIGYWAVDVTRANGEPELDYSEDGEIQAYWFGPEGTKEDDRRKYSFNVGDQSLEPVSSTQRIRVERKENVLHYYIGIVTSQESNNVNELMVWNNRTREAEAIFPVTPNEKSITFTGPDDEIIKLSPIGLKMNYNGVSALSKIQLNDTKIEIENVSGDKETVYSPDSESQCFSDSEAGGAGTNIYAFEEPIDLDTVSAVYINGTKLDKN